MPLFLLIWRRERDYSGLRPSPLQGRRRYAPTFFRDCTAQVEPRVLTKASLHLINKKAPSGAFLFIGGGYSLLRTSLRNFPCYREIYREFPPYSGEPRQSSSVFHCCFRHFIPSRNPLKFITGNYQGITGTSRTASCSPAQMADWKL